MRLRYASSLPMISLQHLRKTFGRNVAVDDVTLTLAPGEIVGLIGENGAGKTTLMSLVAGELAPDAGAVHGIDTVSIGFVHQHFLLVSNFTIAENLALSAPSRSPLAYVATRAQSERAMQMIAASGLSLPDVTRRTDSLSVGERSKLELIKAIARTPRLLILDEPTSVLTPPETAELFALMRRIADGGCTVVFISHKLPEVLSIATRVAVMRRGRLVLDEPTVARPAVELAQAMTGATAIPQSSVLLPGDGEKVPKADEGLSRKRSESVIRAVDLHGTTLAGISFEVAAGSIVAIIGVSGNGQSELARIAQRLAVPHSGSFHSRGVSSFIPEDRTHDGLIAEMSIAENLALTEPRWSAPAAEARAERLIARYDIRAESARQLAGALSGGNQQKVLMARALDRQPDVLIASEPTRGLDFEATRFVHGQLREAADRGAAVLLISSDLDEAFALAHAFYVMYRGRLSARLSPAEASARAANLMAGLP